MTETEPIARRISYLFCSDFILNTNFVWSVTQIDEGVGGKKKKKREAVEVYLIFY